MIKCHIFDENVVAGLYNTMRGGNLEHKNFQSETRLKFTLEKSTGNDINPLQRDDKDAVN